MGRCRRAADRSNRDPGHGAGPTWRSMRTNRIRQCRSGVPGGTARAATAVGFGPRIARHGNGCRMAAKASFRASVPAAPHRRARPVLPGHGGSAGGQNVCRRPKEKQRAAPQVQRAVSNSGGAREDRTPDLVIANDALSQLSYGPTCWIPRCRRHCLPPRERRILRACASLAKGDGAGSGSGTRPAAPRGCPAPAAITRGTAGTSVPDGVPSIPCRRRCLPRRRRTSACGRGRSRSRRYAAAGTSA